MGRIGPSGASTDDVDAGGDAGGDAGDDVGDGASTMTPVIPAWPAPGRVQALFTTRQGGVSTGPWADAHGGGGLNLGARCGDEPQRVALNRRRLGDRVGLPIRWLDQVHGARAIEVAMVAGGPARPSECADAQVTTLTGVALGVLVADCLPVLLADRAGSIVGAAHAGWRGLSAGVLENTVDLMRLRRPQADIIAWFGPCIGPTAFEVGDDVLEAFARQDRGAGSRFQPGARPGKWWADLAGLAEQRLGGLGVTSITRADACTATDRQDFWSHRRDGVCGRMAGVIWLRA